MQLTRSWRLLPFVVPLFVSFHAHAQSAEPAVSGKGLVGGALLGAEAVMITEAAIKVRPGWAYYLGGGAGLVGGGIAGHFLEDSLSPKSAMYLLSAGMLLAIPTAVAALNATSYDTPLEYTQDTAPTDDSSSDATAAIPPTALPMMPPANAAPVVDAPPASGNATSPAGPATSTSTSTPTTTPATSPTPAPTDAPVAPTPSTTPPATVPESSPAKPQGARELRGNKAVAHWRATPTIVLPSLVDLSGSQLALRLPAVEIQGTYTRREMAMYGVKQQTEIRVPLFQMIF